MALPMPALPALMGEATDEVPAEKPTLAAIFDQLDEQGINELVATAEAATMGEMPAEGEEGEPAEPGVGEEVPATDEAEDTGEAVAEEEEPGAEAEEEDAEPTEVDVEEVASQGFEQMQTWAEKAYEAISGQLEALKAQLKTAQANVEAGADADAIEGLLEQGEETYEAAGEQLDGVMAGVKAQDAHAAATSALQLERSGRIVSKLVEQAAAHAETTGALEAGFYDEPAVKLWAERTAPKMGPIGGI